jgi:formate-dependent nitrite reductase membrane component NrfD
MLVVVYLFLGGLGAGLFIFSALMTFLPNPRYKPLARAAAILAPFPVAIGAGLLIFDLGSPQRFWRLFTTVQWTSPMSMGSWLLIVFTGVAFLHLLLTVYPVRPEGLRFGRRFLRLPGEATRRTLRRLLAAVGTPLAVGVGIYTGVLLGAVPARPFWNTPMVAMLFLFSALSTAAATLLIVATRQARHGAEERFTSERRLLYTADIAIILLEVFLVIPFFLHSALSTASQSRSLDLVLGGPYTLPFWIGFVGLGLLIPLIIEVLDLLPLIAGRSTKSHARVLGYLSAIPVIVGGFILRWVFVFAGQESHFG